MNKDKYNLGSPKALLIGIIASVLIISVLGWTIFRIHVREDNPQNNIGTLNINMSRIMLLDEMLTMSARMAASSGDLSYEERYNKYLPELDILIKKIIRNLPEAQGDHHGKEMNAAYIQLVEMEKRAFALVHAGKRSEASALLESSEYFRQKEIYAKGLITARDAMAALNEQSIVWRHSLKIALFGLCFIVLFLLFMAWMFMIRNAHRWSTELEQHEAALEGSQQRLQVVLDGLDAIVYVADMTTYEVLLLNHYGQQMWGNIVGRTCWQTLQAGQTGPCSFCTNPRLLLPSGEPAVPIVWEFQNTLNHRWYECRDQAIRWPDGRLVRMEIAADITARKKSEEEKNTLFADLQKALGEIKTLQKILPICSSCKKIRDDTGAWNQIEDYISEHTETEFTHGICKDCAKKLYPDYFKE